MKNRFVLRALAGLECGVLGGAGMLACWALGAVAWGQPPWMTLNVLGSLFDHDNVLHRAAGQQTVSGLALHVAIAGAIGLGFGLLMGEARNRLRASLLGLLTGLLWYYGAEAFFWRRLGVLGQFYAPARVMQLAHILYGVGLAWYPYALDRLWKRPASDPE